MAKRSQPRLAPITQALHGVLDEHLLADGGFPPREWLTRAQSRQFARMVVLNFTKSGCEPEPTIA